MTGVWSGDRARIAPRGRGFDERGGRGVNRAGAAGPEPVDVGTTREAGGQGPADEPGARGASREALGSLSEEAARLFEAMQDWARCGGGTAASHLDAVLGSSSTGSPECRLCPICHVLAGLRNSRPEVFEHLAVAAMALREALRELVGASEKAWAARRGGGVEHIDIG